ncbi:MAG: cobyrinate a,c-diamide synthase [Candidatus Merdivicinus sp.]
MVRRIPRILLAAAGSGCGKTTVTCALLAAFQKRGIPLVGFKTGPDYIDPMFHRKVLGVPSRNLDLFLCSRENVARIFAEGSRENGLSVIEGVMGLYDGRSFTEDDCSANHLARELDVPTILILDVKGMSLSAAAVLHGFCTFRPNRIRGVIFNRASSGMYPYYRQMAEAEGIRSCGYLPFLPEASLESRHLGLITADEVENLRQKLEYLGDQASETLDLDAVLQIADEASAQDWPDPFPQQILPNPPTIAIARDKAFCFYYEENLRLLEKLGAKLVEFSPLDDRGLPSEADGLWLGGGYPEEFAEQLAQNKDMRMSILKAIKAGLPTVAECGGYLYLLQKIAGRDGVYHEMVGALEGSAQMTDRLQHFGYAVLTAQKDNLLCKKGESIPIHEFHYSASTDDGNDFLSVRGSRQRLTVHASENLYAGYPHLHLYGNPDFARNFVHRCAQWKEKQK